MLKDSIDLLVNKRRVRRVVLFHGESICYNTLNIFSDILARKLMEREIEVGFIDLNKSGDALVDEYVREMNKGFDAAIAFNSAGQHEVSMGGTYVFEYMNAPFYNWTVDHPCTCYPNIASNLKHYHIICLDRDHVDFVKEYAPDIAGVHFIPLGGQSAKVEMESNEEYGQREYDISFVGSYSSIDKIGEDIAGLPDNLKNASFDMIEYLLDNRELPYEKACRYIYDSHSDVRNLDFADFSYVTSRVYWYMNAYVREETVRYLAESGYSLHLFGRGWETIDDLGKGAVIHGSVSYEDSFKVFETSKISLNVMPWFRDGFHDRIASIMLSGAAVLTDHSKYLADIFNAEGGEKKALMYDISRPDQLIQIVSDAMENPDDLYSIASCGNRFARKYLTWDQRADELIRVMNGNSN